MTEKSETGKAVIYTRVSSKEQTEGYSLATQEQLCRQYAAEHGYEVATVFVERGVSAKTTNRPELQSMLRYVEKNHKSLAVVIIYSVNRLARETFDYLWLKQTIMREGLHVASVTEDLQDTPDGRKNETIKAAEGQCDNEERGEKCTQGMTAAVQAGKFVWRAPLGYLNGGRRNRQSLILGDAKTVALVRKSFDLVDSGMSTARALQEVRREGLRSRDGNELSLNTFRTMLMNRRYTGYITSFGMTMRGDFDPIVPEDVFFRIQPKLHRKPKGVQVRYLRDNPEFPLRGVVKCPVCGHLMTASTSTGNGGKYAYYSCPKCKESRFRKETLENWFARDLERLSLDKENVEALSIAIDANLEASRDWAKRETSRLNGRIASLKEEKNAIVDKCLKGVIPDAMVKEWLAKTSLEEEELKCQLASTGSSVLDTPEVLKRGLAILGDLGSAWQKSNLSTRQQLQGFVFPEGVTAQQEGFGTDPIALCLQRKELPASVITSVVGPPGFEPRTKWL